MNVPWHPSTRSELQWGGRCRLAQLHQVKQFKSREADGCAVGSKPLPLLSYETPSDPCHTPIIGRQGQISRPCRFVTRQLMLVPRRAVSHATICLAALSRYTLLYRVVSAFHAPSGSQAVFVMHVLCKCTRTSKHRCKQGGNRKHTHCVPPLFSMWKLTLAPTAMANCRFSRAHAEYFQESKL
jgi:hypothetical protein